MNINNKYVLCVALTGIFAMASGSALADDPDDDLDCPVTQSALESALDAVVDVGIGATNGGLANHMWGAAVNRAGVVCAVVRTGDLGDQWPGSRVIAMQKAYTANAFSLPGGLGFGAPLSTGNLYGTVIEQGSLFGLQFSNPVNTKAAYGDGDETDEYGTPDDSAIGEIVGGINVFGGGLATYVDGGVITGAIGVSGDTSCTDHVIAWKVRDSLNLDFVPGGVGPGGTDNLNLAAPVAPDTFEHPSSCGPNGGTTAPIINGLHINFPVKSAE